MFTSIKSRLTRFRSDTEGSVTVEAIIVLPVLLWLFGVTWVWFDVSRQHAVNQKANFTVADALSRETDPITQTYIDSSYELMKHMAKADNDTFDLRISVVQYNAGPDQYRVLWSEARGEYAAHGPDDAELFRHRLPIMANKDQLILVESWEDYTPALEAGLNAFEIAIYSFTRPRFAPQVHFEGRTYNANNGWGNGDQDAPGGSLCNNNAENADEGASANECQDNADGRENQGNGRSKRRRDS
ncbi:MULTISPECIES: TadE/TadG family type IV pilus assembly protein [unclassified Roseivivax]|uniref:TadE/TadG family type IV pilus assembly protein n=1 Tax=Roseivivax sp. GX 12232 TaxID=2900547 RepID=UPI001E453662|nr:pilus assembly protein [Roseivivax sp. GX 12232]MCE0506840.1 pilus assembly protein [Roseivivax sp. GX 12232]